jgi:hypothetical protein
VPKAPHLLASFAFSNWDKGADRLNPQSRFQAKKHPRREPVDLDQNPLKRA